MSDPLDNDIKRYYQSKRLDDAKLSTFLDMVQKRPSNKEKRSNFFAFFAVKNWFSSLKERKAFYQPALALSSICAFIFLFFFVTDDFTYNVAAGVAEEVAMNHRKNLKVEFAPEKIRNLGPLMASLEFDPIMPNKMKQEGMYFVGARYCSIAGNLAAQIKLQDKKGRICTLYQSVLTDSLSRIKPSVRKIENIEISMWQENGIFLVAAVTK